MAMSWAGKFVEFEDDNVISYQMIVIGKSEVDMAWSINPIE
jgi:hypothetical protein